MNFPNAVAPEKLTPFLAPFERLRTTLMRWCRWATGGGSAHRRPVRDAPARGWISRSIPDSLSAFREFQTNNNGLKANGTAASLPYFQSWQPPPGRDRSLAGNISTGIEASHSRAKKSERMLRFVEVGWRQRADRSRTLVPPHCFADKKMPGATRASWSGGVRLGRKERSSDRPSARR